MPKKFCYVAPAALPAAKTALGARCEAVTMSLSKEETDDMTKLTTKRANSKDLLRLENENSAIPSLISLKENTKHKIVRPSASSVLDQVKSFLPQMKEAEEILRKKMETSPDDVNIENVDNDDRIIEMNLSLFEYSGESESSSSAESDSESSDEENVGKNKLIQET